MKAFAHTIAVILVFASCYTNTAKGNEIEMSSMVDSVGSDYTANATAIEQKKQEMLAVSGVGERKLAQYGKVFLEEINKFR